jgi:predicted dehydrogenase
MGRRLRIGFIGAGNIAPGHWNRLHATKRAEVVALNEPNRASLTRFYERCRGAGRLPVYADYGAMLDRETLDGVVVMSPHTLHYEQIAACLGRGLHVLSEKPMTCTIKHAEALIDKAKRARRVLMIAYQRHFEPPFRYMRDQIAKGRLGKIEFVQAVQCQEWVRLTKGTWRHRLDLSGGGQLNDSGSHLIDIIMWVTGMKVVEVFAKQENFGCEVDVNSTLSMRFENGALGSLAVIGNAPAWHEDHTIVGSKGALMLRQGVGIIHQDALGKPIPVKLPKYTKNHDSNFVDAMLGRDTPQTPAECGLRTIEVTEAAWRSAATGKPVRVR